MVQGIVVTHGRLGEELLRTAQTIVGPAEHVAALSNAGKSPAALDEELDRLVRDAPEPTIVMVDFLGGSCSHACLRVQHRHDNVRLVAGVNLPMVLAFLNKRGEVPFETLPDEIIERGRASIRPLDSSTL